METKTILKIVLSSPGDVKPERELMKRIVAELNRGIADARNLRLELIGWETAAIPGFHPEGPQGQIDKVLNIPECDILLGIFWQRFGTPTKQAQSGSADEFMTAYRNWKENGRPQIMMYFKTAAPELATTDSVEQYLRVRRFKDEFPKEGLYWTFADENAFEQLVREHLTKLILQTGKPVSESSAKSGDVPAGNQVAAPDARVLAAARRCYLGQLKRRCHNLPLAALGGDDTSEAVLSLEQVYISLDTTTPKETGETPKTKLKQERPLPGSEETPPLSALEAAAACERLVLLGDPGAGKSTFVKYLAARFAAAGLEAGTPLPPGFSAGHLPVFVVLRELIPYLQEFDNGPASPRDLEKQAVEAFRKYLQSELEHLEAGAFTVGLKDALGNGECLLILDGLDEVPYRRRLLVRKFVAELTKHYPLKRVIITCRVRSYRRESGFEGYAVHTLAPFSDDKIGNFITGWYKTQQDLGRFSAREAADKTENLIAAATGTLRELSNNPMMLTTMAIIHQNKVGLPKERVRLYKLAVEVLLHRWQKQKNIADSRLAHPEIVKLVEEGHRLRQLVEALAYQAHKASTGDARTVDLDRMTALQILDRKEYLGNMALAEAFLDYVDQRSGLLVGHGGEADKPHAYGFPHRSFQEYLAGCHLIGQEQPEAFYRELAGEGDYWAQVAQLGAEELYYNYPRNAHSLKRVLELMYALSQPKFLPENPALCRQALWSSNIAVMLERHDIERQNDDGYRGKSYLSRIETQLLSIMNGSLPPPERAQAGANLARLGDPRREVTTLEQLQWCYVPGGAFYLGGAENDAQAFDWEKPGRNIESLDTPYWISRYPVTHAQYQMFVAAGGYQNPHYWEAAKAAGEWKAGAFRGRRAPEVYGAPFDLPNHPVVGVTWYEALAFTRWLTEKWREEGLLPESEIIRLPTELEWEKAARGGLEIPRPPLILTAVEIDAAKAPAVEKNCAPQRIFPWGDGADPERMNFFETNINATSAVGCFPAGASPCGCEEMSGNVWEWCSSKWRNRYDDAEEDNRADASGAGRVIRGGGWGGDAQNCRVSCRNLNSPGRRDRYLGFRLLRAAY